MTKTRILAVLCAVVVVAIIISQLSGSQETSDRHDDPPKEVVHVSKQVEKSCMSCHAVDQNGKLARIEYVRKSPEGWSQTIARMERIHGVQLSAAEREQLVADLSRERGLAPEEAEKVQYWLADKPSYAEPLPQNPNVQSSCITCHAAGRFEAQRRSEEEWKNLKDFHLVMFPSIYLNHRHMDWPAEAEAALEYLAQMYPLQTPEWDKWKGRENDLQGKWKVAGFQGTKGFYLGESQFKKTESGYKEQKQIQFLKSKASVQLEGEIKLYGGFMVRADYKAAGRELKGTYNVQGQGNVIEGDWSEKSDSGLAGEETYYKLQTEKPEIIHFEPRALKKGATNQVTLYGMNLGKLKASDLHLPTGVTAEEIDVVADEQAQLRLTAADSADIGSFAIGTDRAVVHKELVVYDKVDYIKIAPAYGVARMGGEGPMNKVSTQFVAYGMSKGKDGKQGTDDDLTLDAVDAEWSLAAYPEGANSQYLQYLGTLEQDGLYTPKAEGINPAREYTQENVGSATVVAKAAVDGKVFSAQAHLVSTVPDYNNIVH
ncbi:quinohemoprotein amine dehydrogenase subunit alpha [Brevibacillus massiliensis]|jgi:quinohemoprotein amine dehydrogenase|uniref:quinohemoprotein amine dehydrogenase subunit alpha n=1 Tax=Brevibacillus massiliensis TaxID=1118054 RepID=UPI0002EE5D61|nr:quinohemoprotein amine dehydrogenase subunit alpha [Brevibacillus massiliensis]